MKDTIKRITPQVKIKALSNEKYNDTIVAVMHNDFYESSERLLQASKKIIAAKNEKISKEAGQLSKRGFINLPMVKATKEQLKKQQLAEKTAKCVEHYSTFYPNNKFISINVIENICKKYNLIFGEVSLFKGYIPEKNRKEIIKFKVKKKDLVSQPPQYSIAAPEKDMEISSLYEKKGWRIFKKTPPDPVVFCKVRGGYLIITAWGDEASDEEVVNQKMN